MAEKLTAQQIRSIVAAQKPGFEAEPADTGPEEYAAMADQAHVQTGAPDLQYLANKFLKTSQQAARPAAQRDSSAASNATKIVRRVTSVRGPGPDGWHRKVW